MEFWSAGMGKKHLVLGLDRTKYDVEGEEMILTGIVDAPADWNYKVRMTRKDWTNVLSIATSSQAGQFLANSVGVVGLVRMALLILKFVMLLAVFNMAKVLGISPGDKSKEGRREQAVGAKPVCTKSEGGM